MDKKFGFVVFLLFFVLFVALFVYVNVPVELGDLSGSLSYEDLVDLPELLGVDDFEFGGFANNSRWFVVSTLGQLGNDIWYNKCWIANNTWYGWHGLSGAGIEILDTAVYGDIFYIAVRGTGGWSGYYSSYNLTDDSLVQDWYYYGNVGSNKQVYWSEILNKPDLVESYNDLEDLPDLSGFGSYDNLTGVPVVDLQHGLMLHYGFDNSVLDSSGFRRDGTVSGAVYADGWFAECLEFDGSDDYVTVDYDLFQGSCAVAVRVDTGYVYAYIVDGWHVGFYDDSLERLEWFNLVVNCESGVGTDFYLNGELVESDEHYWSVDCAFSCWFYSYTETSSDNERLINRNGASDFRVGYYSNANNAWDGLIDDVRLYNRVLSEYEIDALFGLGV